MQYLLERAVSDEDQMLTERTPRFPHSIIRATFPSRHLAVAVFSPTSLGVPAERHRKYMLSSKTDGRKVVLPMTRAAIIDTFGRQLQLVGDVYFREPPHVVQASLDAHCKKLHLPVTAKGNKPWKFREVLPPGRRDHLARFLEKLKLRTGRTCLSISTLHRMSTTRRLQKQCHV